MYETPSTAIVAELTEDYDERTRLLSLRYMFGWAGGLTMAFLMWHYFMVEYGVTGHLTFETYGLVGSLAMLGAILLSAGGLHRQIPHLHQPPPRQRFRARPDRQPGGRDVVEPQLPVAVHGRAVRRGRRRCGDEFRHLHQQLLLGVLAGAGELDRAVVVHLGGARGGESRRWSRSASTRRRPPSVSMRYRSSGAPRRSCCGCSSGFRRTTRRGCFRS